MTKIFRTAIRWLRSDNLKSQSGPEDENPISIALVAGAVVLAIGSVVAQAQQPVKIPRLGYISGTGTALNQGLYVEALRNGLRDLGYDDGNTSAIEIRGAYVKTNSAAGLLTR